VDARLAATLRDATTQASPVMVVPSYGRLTVDWSRTS